MYQQQAKYGESEKLALAAYEAYLRTLGAQEERTIAAARQLAGLYEAWGKAQKAAEWRAKLPDDKSPQR
jgi:hypothetical protein